MGITWQLVRNEDLGGANFRSKETEALSGEGLGLGVHSLSVRILGHVKVTFSGRNKHLAAS